MYTEFLHELFSVTIVSIIVFYMSHPRPAVYFVWLIPYCMYVKNIQENGGILGKSNILTYTRIVSTYYLFIYLLILICLYKVCGYDG